MFVSFQKADRYWSFSYFKNWSLIHVYDMQNIIIKIFKFVALSFILLDSSNISKNALGITGLAKYVRLNFPGFPVGQLALSIAEICRVFDKVSRLDRSSSRRE